MICKDTRHRDNPASSGLDYYRSVLKKLNTTFDEFMEPEMVREDTISKVFSILYRLSGHYADIKSLSNRLGDKRYSAVHRTEIEDMCDRANEIKSQILPTLDSWEEGGLISDHLKGTYRTIRRRLL